MPIIEPADKQDNDKNKEFKLHGPLCFLSNKWHEKQTHLFKWKQEALQLGRYFNP